MSTGPTDTLTDLYGAVAAHLRGDTVDVELVLRAAIARDGFAPLPFAAAMAAGEYLRDVADEREMSPARLVEVLRVAHADLSGCDVVGEGAILAGVSAYLDGHRCLWADADLDVLARDPYRTSLAAVKVVAAALTWHARDQGTDPLGAAQSTCLALAQRACAAGA